MKCLSYLLSVLLIAGCIACGSRNKPGKYIYAPEVTETDTTIRKTSIRFTATEHDFGQVKEGEKVEWRYEFVNTGDADLLLQKVQASCGCTKPEYDKKPIRPGKKGHIEVAFNTKGRPGKQRKAVTVITNTEPPTTVLSFTCEVLPGGKK